MRHHVQSIAYHKWIASAEGLKCLKGRTGGEYLSNDILVAFQAGWEAAKLVIWEAAKASKLTHADMTDIYDLIFDATDKYIETDEEDQ